MTAWAILRQVVMATDDIDGDGKLLRDTLRLGPGFADPELATIGLADDTLPLAGGSYLELVAPLTPDSSVARWLVKMGGRAGYALSVQHPDPLGVRDRALAMGIRVVADLEVMGHPIVQLHPADVGVLLELDGITDQSAWFWDDLGVSAPSDALVDDVLGVRIGTADPAATAQQWSRLLDLPGGPDHSIDLGGRTVWFVPAATNPQWTVLLRRSSHEAQLVESAIAGVRLRYV